MLLSMYFWAKVQEATHVSRSLQFGGYCYQNRVRELKFGELNSRIILTGLNCLLYRQAAVGCLGTNHMTELNLVKSINSFYLYYIRHIK